MLCVQEEAALCLLAQQSLWCMLTVNVNGPVTPISYDPLIKLTISHNYSIGLEMLEY